MTINPLTNGSRASKMGQDSELWRLKTELKTERELCQSALQESKLPGHWLNVDAIKVKGTVQK